MIGVFSVLVVVRLINGVDVNGTWGNIKESVKKAWSWLATVMVFVQEAGKEDTNARTQGTTRRWAGKDADTKYKWWTRGNSWETRLTCLFWGGQNRTLRTPTGDCQNKTGSREADLTQRRGYDRFRKAQKQTMEHRDKSDKEETEQREHGINYSIIYFYLVSKLFFLKAAPVNFSHLKAAENNTSQFVNCDSSFVLAFITAWSLTFSHINLMKIICIYNNFII